MTRNSPKAQNQAGNEAEEKAPPTSSGKEMRTRFQQLQLEALERTLRPVKHPLYDLNSSVGVIHFTHWIIDARMQRLIGVDDAVILTRACDMLLRYHKPCTQGTQVNVTQQVSQQQFNVAELKKLLPTLPEDEQIVLAKGIKRIENGAKT